MGRHPQSAAPSAASPSASRSTSRSDRRRVTLHALAFVVGFTLVFTAVGASAGLVGTLLVDRLDLLSRAGGTVLIVLGLHMSGLIHLPYLDRTYQLPRIA